MTHDFDPDHAFGSPDRASVIDTNPLYDSFIEARDSAAAIINDPQCSADLARDELAKLENHWHGYIGEVAKVSGMIRGYDEELDFEGKEEDKGSDGISEFAWCLGDSALELRFVGVDALADAQGAKHIVFTLADKWADPTDPTYAVIPEQAVYAFETTLPPVRSHILHELEGPLMADIDARLERPLDDPEGLRGLKIDISPTKYSDYEYDVVGELETYINESIDCDRKYPSRLTIDGVIIDENMLMYRTKGAGIADATYGTFSLMRNKEKDGGKPYRVVATINLPTADHNNEDTELTFLLDCLKNETSLRPQSNPIERLRQPEAHIQPITNPLQLEPLEAPETDDAFEYVAQREMQQNIVEQLCAYGQSVTEVELDDDEEARELARECYEQLIEMLGDHLDGVPFIACGDGVKFPCYLANGPVQPNDLSNIAFQLAPTLPKPEKLFAEPTQVYIIGVDIIIEADDEHEHYQVVPSLKCQLATGRKSYPLESPADKSMAALITVEHFCSVQLDGSATITERDTYNRQQFGQAMQAFDAALEEAPDLREVYDKLQAIAAEVRTSNVKLHTIDPELFREIGDICSGDEVACKLVNKALSTLFGSERIARLKGQGHDTRHNSPRSFNSLVRLSQFISTQEGQADVREPYFTFQVLDNSTLEGATHFLPLRELESIEI